MEEEPDDDIHGHITSLAVKRSHRRLGKYEHNLVVLFYATLFYLVILRITYSFNAYSIHFQPHHFKINFLNSRHFESSNVSHCAIHKS